MIDETKLKEWMKQVTQCCRGYNANTFKFKVEQELENVNEIFK